MFKIENIRFNHNAEYQEYSFSMNSFIYGPNTVGKTALTKALDFVLGSSDALPYQGLENIDSFESLLSNGKTNLWIKRTIQNDYFYRRTTDSEYSAVSADTYKKNICLILNANLNNHLMEVYERVFDEHVTFRSFSFLNFIDEKGLGDLSIVFTKAKELKHQVRIRNIMDFFFNFENIEQIYEKQKDLDQSEKDYTALRREIIDYYACLEKIKKVFSQLHLTYTGDISKDFDTFKDFKLNFSRRPKNSSPDLAYLVRSSFSLSEEMKLYSFMNSQSENIISRKEHISKLLAILDAIIEQNPNYKKYSESISEMIDTIEKDKIILSLTDYNSSISKIKNEKDKIDQQIETIRSQASELEYDTAIKKIGLLEDCFSTINKTTDISRVQYLEEHIKRLKADIKKLRSNFNKENINKFNAELTARYLSNDIHVKHVDEDRKINGFSVEFDPFRLFLLTAQTDKNIKKYYWSGSMTRQTHLQILTYLCMFDYLKVHFDGFIYLPVLIIDSANQPMGNEIFKEIYPSIIRYANQIGLQTIFLSKEKVEGIQSTDFIDISRGLNKFHNVKKDR